MVQFPNSLGELCRHSAALYGNKIALVFKDRCYSYRQLEKLSNRVAQSLLSLGIQKGDRVSIYMENCPEWIISYYAAFKVGAIVNPINSMLTPEEVIYVLNDNGASLLYRTKSWRLYSRLSTKRRIWKKLLIRV